VGKTLKPAGQNPPIEAVIDGLAGIAAFAVTKPGEFEGVVAGAKKIRRVFRTGRS
jgi:hypothetical protein